MVILLLSILFGMTITINPVSISNYVDNREENMD